MGEWPLHKRIFDWLVMRLVYAAYRLIWLASMTGCRNARAVHRAMYDSHLDIPKPPSLAAPEKTMTDTEKLIADLEAHRRAALEIGDPTSSRYYARRIAALQAKGNTDEAEQRRT